MSKKVTKMSKMKKINKNGYFLSFTRSCIERIAILLKKNNWAYKNKGIASSRLRFGMGKRKKKQWEWEKK